MRWLLLAGLVGFVGLGPLASAIVAAGPEMPASADFSAQARQQATRPGVRPRITVRPLDREPRDLRDAVRVCAPHFEERLIPHWGGLVLYASQRCRWVRP